MKNIVRFPFALTLAAALALAPSSAPALFGGGEKARLLEKADAEYAAAQAAAARRETVTQMTALRKAAATYRQLRSQYPDYEAAAVSDRLRDVTYTLGALDEKVRRGELALPADELSASAQGVPAASSAAIDGKRPTEAAAPDYRRPIPTLVRTDAAPAAAPAAPAAAPAADAGWMREAIPNPLFADSAPGASSAAGAAAARPAALAAGSGAVVPAPDDPARLARFSNMIRAGRATDAVVELEDVLDAEGAGASVGTRTLFARALLACGNYARAADALQAVPPEADGDPSVLSLRAVSAVAQGDLPRAQLLLDRLVTAFPDFSDAYVDFAYVTFLSDPQSRENRDVAVTYYRTALMRGAKRDPRLEEELGIHVE